MLSTSAILKMVLKASVQAGDHSSRWWRGRSICSTQDYRLVVSASARAPAVPGVSLASSPAAAVDARLDGMHGDIMAFTFDSQSLLTVQKSTATTWARL